MKRYKGILIAATAIVATALVAIGIAIMSKPEPPSWRPEAQGPLGIVSSNGSLGDRVDIVPENGAQLQPATAAEAAEWLNRWPYRSRAGRRPPADEERLSVGAQSAEVRCSGPPVEPSIVPDGDDAGTLAAIRRRQECEYAKWKVWSGETAESRPNERHTVWADEAGRFHGRVDYWR